MEKLNNGTDVEKYCESGNLTQPFLSDEELKNGVQKYLKRNGNIVDALNTFIHKHIHTTMSKSQIREKKFQRTAKQVWEDGYATGCTDYAIVFATLARQMGYATTFLQTTENDFMKSVARNGRKSKAAGHAFCEICVDGNWVLNDPTFSRHYKQYNPNGFRLGFLHFVGGKKNFTPYFRGLDLGGKMTTQQVVSAQVNACRILSEGGNPQEQIKAEYEENLKGNEIEPSIEQVSKEEISETGYHDENPQIPKVDVKTKKETALEETEEKELQE